MVRGAWCCAVLTATSALAFACGAFSSSDDPAATADASALDSATSGDSSTVDAGNADATTVRFCESLTPKPTFCVDFDEGEPAPTNFDEQIGTMTIDSRLPFSAPGSLVASTQDGGGNAEAISWLGRTLTGVGTSSYRASFMVRIGDDDGGALPVSPYGIIFRIHFGEWSFDLDVKGLGYFDVLRQAPDAGSDTRTTLLRRPAPGVWTKIELRLTDDPAGGKVRAELDIGGKPAFDPITTACPDLSSSPRLFLGLIYSNGAVVRYDDVVFDAR
jgi:hypothetical protein